MDLERLTPADFEPHKGTDFGLAGTDDELSLRLTGVERLPAQSNAPRPEPFSLVFTGPREPRLEQGTHRLEHARMGALEVFLVPIGYAPNGGMLYEAVFN